MKAATTYTAGVHPLVAGTTHVDNVALESRVGRRGIDVWLLFMQRRDFDGYSALTRRTIHKLIQFDTGSQRKALEHVLRRLALAGLVVAEPKRRPHTWMTRGVARTRLLNVRKVVGDVDTKGQFVVPSDAWARLMALNTRGGSRAGAGRRKNQSGEVMGIKVGTHSDYSKEGVSPDSSAPSEQKNGGGSPRSSFLESKCAPADTPQLAEKLCPPRTRASVFNDASLDSDSGNCFVIGSSLRPAAEKLERHLEPHQRFYGPDLLPPFPSIDLLNPAVIPSPPLLDADDPDGAWALALVRAYRGAVSSRFQTKSHTFRRGNLTTSRYFKPLVEAARRLQEHEIAPASWAAFSCDVWRKYGKTAKPPALQWVFAAKRIDERAGWFKSEVSSYTGRRLVFSDSARELVYRYQRARMLLHAAEDEVQARETLSVELPLDTYRQLLDSARKEADAERTRLRVAIERGEWLWS